MKITAEILATFDALSDQAKEQLKISLQPPAPENEIKALERMLTRKLPEDLRDFYHMSNGMETDDNFFRIIPARELMENLTKTGKSRLYFAEYLNYCDTWDLMFDPVDTEKYSIAYTDGTGLTLALAHNLPEFFSIYAGELNQGTDALYKWFDHLRKEQRSRIVGLN